MATDKINFTKATLDRIACPTGKDRVWAYDARTPSLALLTTGKGAKSFYVYRRARYRLADGSMSIDTKPVCILLGGYPEMTIDQARDAAAVINGRIAKGEDPMADKRQAREAMTLTELLEHYCNTWAKQRCRGWKGDVGMFERYFGKAESERKPDDPPPPFPGWRNRKVNTITEADVAAIHAKIGSKHPYAANRLRGLLSAMFNRAKLFNPAEHVERFDEHPRDRFMDRDELPKFFRALATEPSPTMRDFWLLAILSGLAVATSRRCVGTR
jgi:hypothetical protein